MREEKPEQDGLFHTKSERLINNQGPTPPTVLTVVTWTCIRFQTVEGNEKPRKPLERSAELRKRISELLLEDVTHLSFSLGRKRRELSF
jgi:hypothetical protein